MVLRYWVAVGLSACGPSSGRSAGGGFDGSGSAIDDEAINGEDEGDADTGGTDGDDGDGEEEIPPPTELPAIRNAGWPASMTSPMCCRATLPSIWVQSAPVLTI